MLHGDHEAQVREALARGLVSEDEAGMLRAAHEARRAVITVDDFAAL
jgi:hypothetical protein